MIPTMKWSAVAVLACLFLPSGCGGSKPEATAVAVPPAGNVPAEHQKGEAVFNRFCMPCHGKAAAGTDRGPTFISRIYEPSHHGDPVFLLAPRMGVRAHHWPFGDMPKIEGVTDEDLKEIVGYVRWLQRQAGIQ